MNHNSTLEVYKGRSIARPFALESSGDVGNATATFRAWKVADEPLPADYDFVITKDLQYTVATGEGIIALTPQETDELEVGAIYRWRIESTSGDEIFPAIGGRLYVGYAYGQ